jgi:hypothetical protein
MNKCIWCGKQSYEVKEVAVLSTNIPASRQREISFCVCPEHEEKLRRYYDRARCYGPLFLGLNAIFLLCLIISALLGNYNYLFGYLFIGSFAAIGTVMFIFPFCSQTTFELMSITTAIKLTRIMGGVIFGLGTAGLILALLYG